MLPAAPCLQGGVLNVEGEMVLRDGQYVSGSDVMLSVQVRARLQQRAGRYCPLDALGWVRAVAWARLAARSCSTGTTASLHEGCAACMPCAEAWR